MKLSDIFVLSDRKFKGAKNLSVIKFDYFKKDIDLSKYDALIFTSKNGIEAIDRIDKSWRKIASFCIGKGTKKEAEKKGGNCVFTASSSYGDDFAREIVPLLKGKRALFLRAKVVTSKLNEILRRNGINLDEEIVYETSCVECEKLFAPPKNSVIIFSSPSTIECFFRCFSWDESYKAVVIGKKTASFMPKEIKYFLSNEQTIPSCIEFAGKLRKKSL